MGEWRGIPSQVRSGGVVRITFKNHHHRHCQHLHHLLPLVLVLGGELVAAHVPPEALQAEHLLLAEVAGPQVGLVVAHVVLERGRQVAALQIRLIC